MLGRKEEVEALMIRQPVHGVDEPKGLWLNGEVGLLLGLSTHRGLGRFASLHMPRDEAKVSIHPLCALSQREQIFSVSLKQQVDGHDRVISLHH